jgi:hypothetical protein
VSVAPINLVLAHPWQRVVFTTYALSLSFFEAVILDALVRAGGGAQPLILADVHGVRESLSEQGAHRVGKDYDVEPIAVTGGVFHPKISVLWAPDECHLLVGSGNLTFNGWGGNCEILEHLHPGFAADAIVDAADFFDLLSASDRLRHGAGERCSAVADNLRRAVRGQPRNRDIRLLYNLDSSIADQVAQIVADLGGALRIVAAAPFWDAGGGIDHLCQTIGIGDVFIHSHAKGSVQGQAGLNWPHKARTKIHAVRLNVMDTPSEAGRPLHAKAFEILCRRGRVLVSGSANGTAAALGADSNIEACIVRIQRDRSIGWSFVAAEPPVAQTQPEVDDKTEHARAGVLRAVLDTDEVTGQVLTPKMSGPVSVYHLAAIGPELLSETMLRPDGSFCIIAPDLEKCSWRGGRLVIRIRDAEGQQAEGFVSATNFAEVTRRSGIIARRLFAFIAGHETPEDVAAILSWFHEDLHRLAPDPGSIQGGGAEAKVDDSDLLIPVTVLSGNYTDAFAAAKPHESASSRSWSRFIDQILLALREPRGPFSGTDAGRAGDEEEDGTSNDLQRDRKGKKPVIDKAFSSFNRLFKILTKEGTPVRNIIIAFELTGYICDRLRPDDAQARSWLERIVEVLLNAGVPKEHREDIAAAILTMFGVEPTPGYCRWARSCLLRIGADFAGPMPCTDGVQGYQTVLLQQESFPELWLRVCTIRTYPEQVRAYLEALKKGEPSPDDYRDLPGEVHDEWPVLKAAVTSPEARQKLLFANSWTDACPACHVMLPEGQINKLRSTGIATAKNCCRKIVIWEGA